MRPTRGGSVITRVFSIAVVVCLLSSSTPAAAQTIIASAHESYLSFVFWYNASGPKKVLQREISTTVQQTQTDRDAQVGRLQIFPSDVTIDIGENVRFSAV